MLPSLNLSCRGMVYATLLCLAWYLITSLFPTISSTFDPWLPVPELDIPHWVLSRNLAKAWHIHKPLVFSTSAPACRGSWVLICFASVFTVETAFKIFLYYFCFGFTGYLKVCLWFKNPYPIILFWITSPMWPQDYLKKEREREKDLGRKNCVQLGEKKTEGNKRRRASKLLEITIFPLCN